MKLSEQRHQETILKIAGILATLAELPDYTVPTPASIIYIGIGMDLQKYEELTGIMVEMGWITKTQITITLTEAGKAKGDDLNKQLAAAKGD